METNHFSVLISPRLFLKTPAFAGLLSSLGLFTPRFSAQGWIFRGGGDWRGLMRNMERVKRTPEVSLLVDADVRQIRAFPAQLGSDLGAVAIKYCGTKNTTNPEYPSLNLLLKCKS